LTIHSSAFSAEKEEEEGMAQQQWPRRRLTFSFFNDNAQLLAL
jgi:hypothetical protein